ncbi:hypothetical protein B0F90DRAFT_1862174 [Multifurca ochricompacta]|uniref:Transmembrane protein n=1 Tax=Multifurca ochricompacta TaxID=376703 RepID=A0AAD4QMA4_9AGAM|nr:hypothetical protein B0F90DRAFT_1862174 [Multifurca ochricompacta]
MCRRGDTLDVDVLINPSTVNAYLFGVISQQMYSYWTCGFKDSRRLKAFVVALFVIVALQSSMLWVMAWNVYTINTVIYVTPKEITWEGPANSACQCILILSANIFLAARIHKLTSSRLQSGLVIALSISAFVIGVVNIVTTWISKKLSANVSSCIGLFAAFWSIAELATYFMLPDWTIYTIFDMTSGSIYTHMIYDTLLSRTRLRERMAEQSHLEMVLPTSNPLALEGKGMQVPGVAGVPHPAVSLVTMGDFRFTQNGSSATGTTHDDNNSELECAPVGKTAPGYEFPYNANPGE